ncbi:MAG: SAM-dependent methyltransferase [Bacteroidetes bacterium]|nr:SAM-dependent methyltransferase [Bacteroidota bacterium]MDA0937601.1 SAM-dependent methyltransferase [Bacteroidota bacterium]MDA1345000.1 SAM-dependent methyltransferase [Bacteroidota bacterium]
MNNTTGPLILIPSPLGDTAPMEVLPLIIRQWIERIDHYIVENEKTARRFIKKIAPNKKQSELVLSILDKYSSEIEIKDYLNPCLEGKPIGLLSDAGCPGIADPGALIVAKAHHLNIVVKPLVGPSSIFLALMASGLNGQNFAFNGYLPIDKAEKRKAILKLEQRAMQQQQAQLFIETPYRNTALFEQLCDTLNGKTKLTIATNLTLPEEYIKTNTVSEWKKTKGLDLHKKPTLFIFQ